MALGIGSHLSGALANRAVPAAAGTAGSPHSRRVGSWPSSKTNSSPTRKNSSAQAAVITLVTSVTLAS